MPDKQLHINCFVRYILNTKKKYKITKRKKLYFK